MSATRNDGRYAKFLELMPIYKYNVTKSALEAGFAPSYATGHQKEIMQRAIQWKTENSQALAISPTATLPQLKATMAELVGFTREELMVNLKELGTQEKDLSVRLRVIAPLAREYGVNLEPEKSNLNIVPTLHITVDKTDIANEIPLNEAT